MAPNSRACLVQGAASFDPHLRVDQERRRHRHQLYAAARCHSTRNLLIASALCLAHRLCESFPIHTRSPRENHVSTALYTSLPVRYWLPRWFAFQRTWLRPSHMSLYFFVKTLLFPDAHFIVCNIIVSLSLCFVLGYFFLFSTFAFVIFVVFTPKEISVSLPGIAVFQCLYSRPIHWTPVATLC